MRYEVQTYTLCDGWINTSSYAEADGILHPETFTTAAEAQAALDEFFEDLEEEVAAGNMENYHRSEFRIQHVQGAAPAAQPDAAGVAP